MLSKYQKIPNYLKLIQFQGLIRKDFIACINLLEALHPYKNTLYNNRDLGTLFRCFVQVMDTDNCMKQLRIINMLSDIVGKSQHHITDRFHIQPVLLAAIRGHYNTVISLLETGNIKDSIFELFGQLHNMTLPIAMLILRKSKTYINDPDIVVLIGNCITNNNKDVLQLLKETYFTKYQILTDTEDCQKIIKNMKQIDFVPDDKFINSTSTSTVISFVHDSIKTIPYMSKFESANLYIVQYLDQFAPCNVYYQTQEYMSLDGFIPDKENGKIAMLSSIHDWWYFVGICCNTQQNHYF